MSKCGKGIVVYTDSVETPAYGNTAKTYNIDTDAPVGSLSSRLGKFDVSYIDNSFMTDGVKRCLRMALDVWEDRLSIDAPVHIMLDASEDIDPSLEIKTAVAYVGNGKMRCHGVCLPKQMKMKKTIFMA